MLTVGAGIDRKTPSYGRDWDLGQERPRRMLLWLLQRVLRPRAIHVATPCTRWCVLGARKADAEALALVVFSV
eukprot:11034751-Alexandrium_andersonii.AAC.1